MQKENININVNPKDTLPITCELCGSDKFKPIFFLRKISKFITGEAEDRVMPIDSLACIECNHVNKQLQPFPNENKTKENE